MSSKQKGCIDPKTKISEVSKHKNQVKRKQWFSLETYRMHLAIRSTFSTKLYTEFLFLNMSVKS